MRVCGRCRFDRWDSVNVPVRQCVHLAGNISPDELEETLSRFRSSHAHVEIVIYDSEQISFPDNESDWAQ